MRRAVAIWYHCSNVRHNVPVLRSRMLIENHGHASICRVILKQSSRDSSSRVVSTLDEKKKIFFRRMCVQ